MESVTRNLPLHSLALESCGDLAYDSGDYPETLVPSSGETAQELHGNYIIIF
jgi:hypothetical protein